MCLISTYTQDIVIWINIRLASIFGVFIGLLVECVDSSYLKLDYNGKSSKVESDVKLPIIYKERVFFLS